MRIFSPMMTRRGPLRVKPSNLTVDCLLSVKSGWNSSWQNYGQSYFYYWENLQIESKWLLMMSKFLYYFSKKINSQSIVWLQNVKIRKMHCFAVVASLLNRWFLAAMWLLREAIDICFSLWLNLNWFWRTTTNHINMRSRNLLKVPDFAVYHRIC